MADSTLSRFSKVATDPLRNFRFLVNFVNSADGAPISSKIQSFTGGFSNVGGLGINIQNISYREGGMNTTLHQVPGQASFNPITLQRGTIWKKDEAVTWMKALFAAASGEGINGGGSNFRCNLEIYVLDHPVTNVDTIAAASYKMKFTVYNAWITSLSYNDLSAQGNEILYENITLIHEGISFDLNPA